MDFGCIKNKVEILKLTEVHQINKLKVLTMIYRKI
jgi:hypothetical protein